MFSCTHLYVITLINFLLIFFFFNDTATTEIYTLSLHDALPISYLLLVGALGTAGQVYRIVASEGGAFARLLRSEEHTSELQSRPHLVCRLLLEKKIRSTAFSLS